MRKNEHRKKEVYVQPVLVTHELLRDITRGRLAVSWNSAVSQWPSAHRQTK